MTVSNIPPQLRKKFLKAFIKIHHSLSGKGIKIRLVQHPDISSFELSCIHNKEMYAGLMISYYSDEQLFEVFEYQAGPNKELWIYGYCKSPMAALKKLLKADTVKKPIKIY
ncbi:MAG: hypothetical protein E6Q24_15310 [Chitinophagaceae bacterium]|nr:MAG: hypothetical protein E6Q24_15310 [Chitinophagaceae bacterium]